MASTEPHVPPTQDAVPATPQLPGPGTAIGAYTIGEQLGAGGMGVVYQAVHTRLGRKVALKLLDPALATDALAVSRFLGEARAVNHVEHGNVIEITDIIEDEHKYYIMELLTGETLLDLRTRRGVIPLAQALDIAAQLASALAAVHEVDIVHCDIKPANVFLDRHEGKERVKLIDFGIAQLPGDAPPPQPTEHGVRTSADIVGTPAYMSPEQAEGTKVDHRTDIYAFGVLLYEMVAGRLPFEANSVEEMILKHLSVTPPPPSSVAGEKRRVPQALDELCMQCLAKRPDDRPTSMQEVDMRLSRMTAEQRARDLGPLPKLVKLATSARERVRAELRGGLRGKRLAVVVGAAVALVVLVALGANLLRSTKVKVVFDSAPRGALVRAGDGQTMGRTPFTIELEPTLREQLFVFELKGYTPNTYRMVTLDQDTEVMRELELEPVARPPSRVIKAEPTPRPEQAASDTPRKRGKGSKARRKP